MQYSNTEEGLYVLVLSPIARSVVLKGVVLQGELAKVDDAGKSAMATRMVALRKSIEWKEALQVV